MPSGIDMTPLDELAKLISEKGRKILVAQNPVDLRTLQGENSVFILQLPEGSSTAGGEPEVSVSDGYRNSTVSTILRAPVGSSTRWIALKNWSDLICHIMQQGPLLFFPTVQRP